MSYLEQSASYYWPIRTPLTPETAVFPDTSAEWHTSQRLDQPEIWVDPVKQRMQSVLALSLVIIIAFAIWASPGGNEEAVPPSDASAPAAHLAAAVDRNVSEPVGGNGRISPLFTPEVQYWESLIVRWANEHQLDPNMVATIMQIESCGDPQAISRAGAQGLFQVMPFHFTSGEDMLDPDTNARRGVNYFAERLVQTNGDVGRAFAGYNGGHVAAAADWSQWAAETQRYFTWSTGIYDEVTRGEATSATLQQWLAAGGASLCQQAANRLGLN